MSEIRVINAITSQANDQWCCLEELTGELLLLAVEATQTRHAERCDRSLPTRLLDLRCTKMVLSGPDMSLSLAVSFAGS